MKGHCSFTSSHPGESDDLFLGHVATGTHSVRGICSGNIVKHTYTHLGGTGDSGLRWL